MNKSLTSLVLLVFCGSALLFAQQGLKAEYFNGIEFNQKVATRIDDKIDFYWNETPPVPGLDPNYCSVRWTGRLMAPETGTYTFSARVDDGIRVWVGNVQVINNWNLNDVGIFSGQVKMEAGKKYDLKVEFFNALVEAEITLLWELPSKEAALPNLFGRNYEVVSSDYLQQVPPPKSVTKAPVKKTEPPKPATKPATQKPKPPQKETVPTVKAAPEENPIVDKDTIEKYTPKTVNFERGNSTMIGKSHEELDRLADFLIRHPELKLKVEGHTDVIGDPQKNLELSEERAQAVADYLEQKGVAASQIVAEGFGSSKPLFKGDPKKHYPINRRVAFIIF